MSKSEIFWLLMDLTKDILSEYFYNRVMKLFVSKENFFLEYYAKLVLKFAIEY